MSLKKLLTNKQYNILFKEYHLYIRSSKYKTQKASLKDFFYKLRNKYRIFNKYSDRQLTNQITASRREQGDDEWPNLKNINNYISPEVRQLIEKSIKTSLLAVELYNKPNIQYRSESYIVLMMIAWTALFHAILLNKHLKHRYKNDKTTNNFYDLRKCVNKYEGQLKKEIKANLNFLIAIRDKIVHRNIPDLDETIFGECQACLYNFEKLLVVNFGNKYELNNSLAYSLQFAHAYSDDQIKSIKEYRLNEYTKLQQFIKQYRENLDPDVFQSPHFSFRVFMIPKVGNHLESSDLAVEFIKYDPSKVNEYEAYEKLIYVVKEKRISGDYLKAGDVSKIIYEKLKDKMPDGWKFSASTNHSKCAKYYKIREGYYSGEPEKTNKKYCLYEPVFKQYIYTKEWVEFLLKEISDINKMKIIMKS